MKTTVELIALVSAVSSTSGLILGAGIAWGVRKSRIRSLADYYKQLENSHHKLKDSFVGHKDNTRIHIDPDRDSIAREDFRDSVNKNFEDVKDYLDKLNVRCEKRGQTCGDHFSKIENKMAVATGGSDRG